MGDSSVVFQPKSEKLDWSLPPKQDESLTMQCFNRAEVSVFSDMPIKGSVGRGIKVEKGHNALTTSFSHVATESDRGVGAEVNYTYSLDNPGVYFGAGTEVEYLTNKNWNQKITVESDVYAGYRFDCLDDIRLYSEVGAKAFSGCRSDVGLFVRCGGSWRCTRGTSLDAQYEAMPGQRTDHCFKVGVTFDF